MIDELKLRKDAQRAAKADALLNDELLKEAFAELEAVYLTKWRNTLAQEMDGREKLWMAIKVVGYVRDHLQSAVNNGKVSQAELDAMTTEPKRRRFLG